MTTLEIILTALAPLGTGGGAFAVWLRTRGRHREAREESATAVVPALVARVEAQDRQIDDLRTQSEADRKAALNAMSSLQDGLRAQLEESETRCRERMAEQLEESESRCAEQIAIVARRLAQTLGPDDTGVHELERIARRTPTPPSGTPAGGEPS